MASTLASGSHGGKVSIANKFRSAVAGLDLQPNAVWRSFGWQILLLAPPAGLYWLVRGLSAGQRREAFANARDIVDVQKTFGLDWEAALQRRVLDMDWLITLANWFYIYGHFPLIVLAMLILFRWSRGEYLTLRNAMVFSGAVGLLCFAFYPVAPPRLYAPELFFDSLNELSSGYMVLQNPTFTNQYAAVPSFHVGWNLLVAIGLWRTVPWRLVKGFIATLPLLMSGAVILTANHWVLDIAAGLAVALFGLIFAVIFDRLIVKRMLIGEGLADRVGAEVDEGAEPDEAAEAWGRWDSNPRPSDYESRALTY